MDTIRAAQLFCYNRSRDVRRTERFARLEQAPRPEPVRAPAADEAFQESLNTYLDAISQTFGAPRASDYGVGEPVTNPCTGDHNWAGYGLAYANQALQSVGVTLPELQAPDAAGALAMARANGTLRDGQPPVDAVVFYQDEESGEIRCGVVTEDGELRRPVGDGIGTIPMPADSVGYLSANPVKEKKTDKARKTEKTDKTSKAGDLSPEDQALAGRIDAIFEEVAGRNAGNALDPDGNPNQGLRGQGALIVSLARQYNLPVELLMAQLQKESSFVSDADTLTIANRNPGNLRFADWESAPPFNGKPDGPGNFTTFPSIEAGLTAYAHLLRNVYGEFIDNGDWQGMVNMYAPPSENNSTEYADQLVQYMADFRSRLGI